MAAQLSCSDLQILGACVGSTGASCSARALALQQYVFLGHVLAVSTESLIAQIMMDLFFFFFFPNMGRSHTGTEPVGLVTALMSTTLFRKRGRLRVRQNPPPQKKKMPITLGTTPSLWAIKMRSFLHFFSLFQTEGFQINCHRFVTSSWNWVDWAWTCGYYGCAQLGCCGLPAPDMLGSMVVVEVVGLCRYPRAIFPTRDRTSRIEVVYV